MRILTNKHLTYIFFEYLVVWPLKIETNKKWNIGLFQFVIFFLFVYIFFSFPIMIKISGNWNSLSQWSNGKYSSEIDFCFFFFVYMFVNFFVFCIFSFLSVFMVKCPLFSLFYAVFVVVVWVTGKRKFTFSWTTA